MFNNDKYKEYRESYPNFIYHDFEYIEGAEVTIKYHFEVENLVQFYPTLIFPKELFNNVSDKSFTDYLVFHVGLVELVSYWKATCSPNVIIKAGYINDDQIKWFKKLYYYGLGEFFYVNGIQSDINTFMNITCSSNETYYHPKFTGCGNLIPIGGGKDSVVSLELLKSEKNLNMPFIINPKDVTIACCKAGGYDNYIGVKRKICPNLIKLNNRGFLNGHTPFSALVAFLTYLTAYLSSKKYIVLSNESSANESTVIGTKINHQYSKTYEFENDFNTYTKKYFNIDIKYFSLLRPLSEFQIGMLFSKFKQYHKIFKSCNVGSKSNPWVWCCNCPKCLFVYIILSPFLYKRDLINIFGQDLYEKKELLNTFKELTGNSDTKPFECVGTIKEVRYSISKVINKIESEDKKLPYLLKFYKDNYSLDIGNLYLEREFNCENNLDYFFLNIVKEELSKCINK